MNQLHPPKTAVESRFEEEIAADTRGWQPWTGPQERPSFQKSPVGREESPQDRRIASAMILGR